MKQKLLNPLTLAKNLFNWIKNHKRISLIVIILFVTLGYFLWPKNTKTILTEYAKVQDIIKTVSVTGKTDAENSVNLSFQTGGKLIYLGAKKGETIAIGQAIASLDKLDLEASFRQAQQDFIAAKAASDQYYDNHRNATESYDEKVRRTALDAAQNKAYDQMMKVQQSLNNSTLYSPIEGILTRSDVNKAGVNITPATIFTITDPTSLNFKMEVDEADMGQVRENQKVSVSLDAFPDEILTLKIDKIDFVSHTTTSGGNAFYVEANIPQIKNYRVGLNGNADIIIETKENVLAVSLSSVEDDSYVYVKKGSKFEKRKVKLGLQNDILAEIKSGLSEGELVAIDYSSVPQNQVSK